MIKVVRFVVSIPLGIGDLIWARITRNSEERFIADQQQWFIDQAEGR